MPTRNYFPIFGKLKQGAYSYVWTEECERLLPRHYKSRCLEYMLQEPTPVHWFPDSRKYKLDKYGQRKPVINRPIQVTNPVQCIHQDNMKPVQNHPIQVRYPVQCNKGLWGGEGIIEALKKRKIYSTRVPCVYFPQIYNRALYSEILDQWFTVPVTMRAMYLIDDAYGLDNYILGTHERDLNSKLGMDLKRTLLVTLAKQSLYPDNPEKGEKILKKYEKYIIPLEEAEWVGLSIEEALQKAEDIQAARPVVTPKEIFTKQLVEKMQEQKDETEAENKFVMLDKAKRLLSPFKSKDK